MTGTVLILGASGKIGRHAARAFATSGWAVRRYDRAAGDMVAQAAGADVIVNGLNPPNYHDWAGIIPAITRDVIAAARASGASVIIPGNVYNYGAEPGTWTEATPWQATTRKGRIRIEMEREYAASGVQTIILRAGNFIDPDRGGDLMSLVMLKSLARGRISYPGRADAMQAYCYLPDWAEAAVRLANGRGALLQFEDIPLGGLAFTASQLKAELEAQMGQGLRLGGFPWWLMTLTAPFWELARELSEMRYLWDTDHQLGTDRLRRLLPGFAITTLPEVVRAILPAYVQPDDGVPAPVRRAVGQ